MKSNNVEHHANGITLRTIEDDDAQFILSLRTDPAKNKYLNKAKLNIKQQLLWQKEYYKRQQNKQEFYFTINNNEARLGLVRIYEISNDLNSFTWGSWIITDNAPKSTAIRSALALYDFAFNKLNLSTANLDVRRNNKSVIKFHTNFGCTQTMETENDIFFTLTKNQYIDIKNGRYKKFN